MVRGIDQEFRSVRNKRSARYSNAHNLRVLSKTNHNKPLQAIQKSLKKRLYKGKKVKL